jgi:hypothetical protein
MWHVLHMIARLIEVLLGLFCVLTAIVLYPGEEGKIQSKFEDFWVTVDDYQKSALSKHAAFMQQVARLETHFLDIVFGHRLFSGKAATVSFSLSLATISIFGAVIAYQQDFMPYVRLWLGFLCGSILLGGACIFLRKRLLLIPAVLTAVSLILLWLYQSVHGSLAYLEAAGLLFVLVSLLGFFCDISFVALTRRLLRFAGEMTSFFRILLVVVGTICLGIGLMAPYLASQVSFPGDFLNPDAASQSNIPSYLSRQIIGFLVNPFLYSISVTNVFDAMLALVFVLLAVILLVHRAAWPLLTRTLFHVQDIGTKGRRAVLIALGIALLSGKLDDLLQKLIEKFGG